MKGPDSVFSPVVAEFQPPVEQEMLQPEALVLGIADRLAHAGARHHVQGFAPGVEFLHDRLAFFEPGLVTRFAIVVGRAPSN